MNIEQYKQIQKAWNDIEQIEWLESLCNKDVTLSLTVNIFHRSIQTEVQSLPPTVRLSPDINAIILDALKEYKDDLKARMAAIELNDTMAMPIATKAID